MKKASSRARTISALELDSAVEEALQRVAQVRELRSEECASVSGGILAIGGGVIGGIRLPPDAGFIAVDPSELSF